MTINLGYACINTTLQKQSKIMCNRGMIKRTWRAKGMPYASELALSNVRGLQEVVKWNNDNGISVYRITSSLFPWMSEYDITQLPDYQAIAAILADTGKIARQAGQRLSFHPGQFCVLASPTDATVSKTIKELDQTAQIMDMLGMPQSPAAKINIHVGGAYGERENALARFCNNFKRLTQSAQSRITVENDDKASLYSTRELCEVHERIGIPIVFDYHHHKFCDGGQDEEEALLTACMTWGDTKPVVHYSQSRSEEHSNPKIRANAHSDSYWTPIDTYGLDIDIMLECKHKEVGLYKMQELMKAA